MEKEMETARRSIDDLIDLIAEDGSLNGNYRLRIAVAKVKAALHELEGTAMKLRLFAQPRVLRS